MRGGLGILAALAAAVLVGFLLDQILRAVQEGPRLVVVSPTAPGLGPGAAVWVAGRPAGRVLSVRLRPGSATRDDNITVIRAVLHREAIGVLREDASARVAPAGLMAPTVLSLSPGSPERPPHDFRDTIRATVALLDQERALARIDSLSAALETVRGPALRLRSALEEGDGTLAALRRDPSLLARLEERRGELERLLGLSGEGKPGGLARFFADPELAAGLERTAASLRRLEEARREPSGAGPALDEVVAALGSLAARLDALERDLERGHGSLGRALADPEVARQRDLLAAQFDSLRAELLARPLRWLRIRLF